MHRPHRLLPLAVAVVAAVAGALAGVSAGSPSARPAWLAISGPTQPPASSSASPAPPTACST